MRRYESSSSNIKHSSNIKYNSNISCLKEATEGATTNTGLVLEGMGLRMVSAEGTGSGRVIKPQGQGFGRAFVVCVSFV